MFFCVCESRFTYMDVLWIIVSTHDMTQIEITQAETVSSHLYLQSLFMQITDFWMMFVCFTITEKRIIPRYSNLV